MLWLELAPLQQDYNWALHRSLQNILANYCFGSLMYFEEKTIKTCENQNNCKEMYTKLCK
jgi:hypothetical protein